MTFELFVAGRYLRAKRRQRFISVVTAIAVLGVGTGVMALVVAMAINNGVQQDLQRHLLGATAHVNLLEKERGFGIDDWRIFMERFRNVDHVAAMAPALYGEMMISGPIRARGCVLKGIDPEAESRVGDLLTTITEGSVADLIRPDTQPGIILGKRLAETIGARLNSVMTLVNPQGELTPFGPVPGFKRVRVAAIFESGFYEYDNYWAIATLETVQQSLSLGDVINAVDFKLDDLDLAASVSVEVEKLAGAEFAATSWMERNREIFNALKVEKLVTTLIIGLIMLVAALNVLTSLVMMVMEKKKGIAMLMSMGARRSQIWKIFALQGVIIGAAGTALGLLAGHFLCWLCATYRLIPLEAQVYGLSYVPFAPRAWESALVALAALFISLVTTIYPSATAARILPLEVLRYE